MTFRNGTFIQTSGAAVGWLERSFGYYFFAMFIISKYTQENCAYRIRKPPKNTLRYLPTSSRTIVRRYQNIGNVESNMSYIFISRKRPNFQGNLRDLDFNRSIKKNTKLVKYSRNLPSEVK